MQSGRIFIDGKSTGDVEGMVLRDRWRLARDGIIIILLTIEKLSGRVISGPDIISRGFFAEQDVEAAAAEQLKRIITHDIAALDPEIIVDTSIFEDSIRRSVKRYFRQEFDQKPMIMLIIMEV